MFRRLAPVVGEGFTLLASHSQPIKADRLAMQQSLQPKQFVQFDATTELLRAQKVNSPKLAELDQGLLLAQQTRFQSTVEKAAKIYERAFPEGHVAPEHSPLNIAQTMLANSFKPLMVRYDSSQAPHYNPKTNSVSVMMKDQADPLAHEFQHAYDHLSGLLDLTNNTHTLYSEKRAFESQGIVSRQLYGKDPENWEKRTAQQMAQSYEGKTEKGYVGTLQSSEEAVHNWQKKTGGY
ncbi:hypothetical protein DLREEDagrD3_25590 [Denitratisoma sp. agr-D3]